MQQEKDQPGLNFAQVFAWELAMLAPQSERTAGASSSPELTNLHGLAARQQLAGLALSGGGIRSATFNLGVLQALADLGLLSKFDYLSTVSGGGYIGGWLSKWIHTTAGGVEQVEKLLRSGGDGPVPRAEPKEVQFLRKYSNYLTPKSGMFSADTWTLIGTYVRNTLLNMTMLVTTMSLLFLAPRFLLVAATWLREPPRTGPLLASLVIFLLSVASMALNLSLKGPALKKYARMQKQSWILWTVCAPLLLAAFFGSIAFVTYHSDMNDFMERLQLFSYRATWLLAPGAVYFLVWAAGWGAAQYLNHRAADAAGAVASPLSPGWRWWQTTSEALGHLAFAIGALAAGTLLMLLAATMFGADAMDRLSVVHLVTFGMPAMLALFGITMTLMIGLIGRLYSDASREWWARQGAWTMILAAGWLLVCGSTFYLPALLAWAFDSYAPSAVVSAAVTSLITFLGLRSGGGRATGDPGNKGRLELVAKLAPYAFSILFVGLLTMGLMAVAAKGLPHVSDSPSADKLDRLPLFFRRHAHMNEAIAPCRIGLMMAACLLSALLLGCRLDINKFSLYMMYRLRLARAYFGATTRDRTPHPFTGFDPLDDVPLHELLYPQAALAASAAAGQPPGPVSKPYHIFNAAINLVQGQELAWQTRKAANFFFSPGYCGFELPGAAPGCSGFRPTRQYASQTFIGDDLDNGIKLGTAVAVSGAAASPNMGYHSSPPLSFLMTLFNLRLGRWSPNPAKSSWQQSSPGIGLISIVKELFGLTNAGSNFIYLSDGGHFENLGLYELVRRRCQLIVVVDASCDDNHSFDDLGNAIRKCLTDFNVLITLEIGGIQSKSAGAAAGSSYVTGRIRYHQADGGEQEGVLLYLKPVLTGGENADVFNYSKLHPEFPHESTADQWFDENQFDSYRSLGRYIATRALGPATSAASRAIAEGDMSSFITRLSNALVSTRPASLRSARRRQGTAKSRMHVKKSASGN